MIASDEVDMTFGTGALGVTPAHSMADWEMAKKNNLKIIKVINENAKILDGFGVFSQKNVLEARELIVEKLKKQGLLSQEEEINNNLSVCERCKTAIEPLPSNQWFVNVDHANFSLKKEARQAIETDQIKIYPERFKKIMLDWIDNVHDWCISRQIWWGPRIPAWYKDNETKAGINSPGKGWIQDNDTFDTWFSSGQWAYTALGYPNEKDYKEFYPSDTMIMGRDILPFWAFRMIILSLYRTRQVPFKNLYFTGLVRDSHGQKMSKSKGNGIDPLNMIERYGTDAVRLSLLIGSAPGNDMNLGEAKIAGYRNFSNKLWNISRYILGNYETPNEDLTKVNKLTLADRWILTKLHVLIAETTEHLNNYQFSLAGEKIKEFTWTDFADWYLEVAKFEKTKSKPIILYNILENILKLWHPFMPFVTEAIWTQLEKNNLLLIEEWPQADPEKIHESSLLNFETIKNIITQIRNARNEYGIKPTDQIQATILTKNKVDLVETNANLIKKLRTGLSDLIVIKEGEKIKNSIYITLSDIEIFINAETVDFEKEKKRLEKEILNKTNALKILEKKLSNQEFIANGPKDVVDSELSKLNTWKKELLQLNTRLSNL
ncbi:MAG: class I tRNA ligase family protein [Candidatus Falkowbacteria bacterium]|nr:class I tRNA ligase family protein [Candidatus Falkowbacteria bacterium]